MTDDDTAPRKLDLSTTQVMASALAAVSAAFFASWAGTAGTLIGAAVGSVIATVGAATYSYSLKRSAEAVRRRAAQVREASLLAAALPRTGVSRTQAMAAVEQDVEQATAEAEAEQGGLLARLDPRRVALPWGKVALASAAVMLIALVAITSLEGVTGRSLASLAGDDDAGRTTVTSVVDRGSGDAPTQEPTPTEQPTPTQEPTEEPSGPATEAPSIDPTPTTEPAPTTDPSPTADPTPSPGTSPSAEPSTAP